MLQLKIEQNSLPLSNGTDNTKRMLRLVSSVAIVNVLVSHKVRLDRDKYAKLLSSLVLWQDAKERKTCSSFTSLLSHFPSAQWR